MFSSNFPYSLLIFLISLSLSFSLGAQSPIEKKDEPAQYLQGIWEVDLRPTPMSEGYYQDFTLRLNSDGSFAGEFYGSTIVDGLINRNWEKVYFAFITRDLNNEYYHSGYLMEDTIYGTTYCPNRDFMTPWIAEKKED